jgi:hypothetical protein
MKQSYTLPFLQTATVKAQAPTAAASSAPVVTALSVEFVAKPREAQRVEAAIPAAIAGAFKDVTGFAGCLVMISDQEARLITVVTLWAGDDREKRCTENVRWVRALLAPYVDRCLRVQKMFAHLPVLSTVDAGINSEAECLIRDGAALEDETICVA